MTAGSGASPPSIALVQPLGTEVPLRPAVKVIAWLILAAALGGAVGTVSLRVDPLELGIAGVGVVGLGAVFLWPNAGLSILIAMAYIRASDVLIAGYGAPSIADPFILLMAGVAGWRWLRSREAPNRGLARAAILLTAFGLVGLSTLLHAADPDRAQAALVVYGKNALFALLVIGLLSNKEGLRSVVWALLISGTAVAALGVYQVSTGRFDQTFGGFAAAEVRQIIGATSSHRLGGPIGDPNYFAQFLVVLVPLAVDRMRSESSGLRLFAGISLALYLVAIAFTFSRGGFLALAVVVGMIMFQVRPKPRSLLIGGAAVMVAIALLPTSAVDRLMTIPSAIQSFVDDDVVHEDGAVTGRTSEVLVAWQMFGDNQLTGVGLDNYPVHYQEYSSPLGLDPRPEERFPHNLYLEVAAETGIPGLLAFGAILIVALTNVTWAARLFAARGWIEFQAMTTALWTGMVGYLVAALFIHGAYPRSLWMLVALSLALPSVALGTPARQPITESVEAMPPIVRRMLDRFDVFRAELIELQSAESWKNATVSEVRPAAPVDLESETDRELLRRFDALRARLLEVEAEAKQGSLATTSDDEIPGGAPGPAPKRP